MVPHGMNNRKKGLENTLKAVRKACYTNKRASRAQCFLKGEHGQPHFGATSKGHFTTRGTGHSRRTAHTSGAPKTRQASFSST